MKAIVVADENWAIGKDGGLLIHLPGDLKYFKEKTLGGVVVMGRATLESLPGGRPLPGRETIVLSRDAKLRERLAGQENVSVAGSVEELRDELVRRGMEDAAFAAGGEQVYRQLLPMCDEVYVTKIARKFEGADCFFPELSEENGWRLTWEDEPRQENGVSYRFTVYKRK
ncbi:dihydrofolate reductase [Bacilliculturomica massiliensis]|uniref:dihydrofolate reductase n=1 Tax=Bacilliculturomica massiliensis TaxID=1917867 RepID=UPI001031F2E1|nr:dihydrofolate reductase [Bacilliculturomica massiliensis]